MPGMYSADDYDLAGFSVGIVEKSEVIDGTKVAAGDTLIGIASSGPHSNGYSLIRKVIEVSSADLKSDLNGEELGKQLLEPTRIYVKSLLKLMQELPIHALAHITGGGLTENIPRVLPEFTTAEIDRSSWQLPAIFEWLQSGGNILDSEMLKTFNCGVGMVVAVAAEDAAQAIKSLNESGESAWKIGEITSSDSKAPIVKFV
jgi:phosphoribosylformylglycinamidine cyclo-ligase